ncbi:MAG TPA: IS66 family transposase [Propionibacteriaceae bacterium]|jgi:transposase|nr:IS66 family transposase [Propionibacteriaceae bacterium]
MEREALDGLSREELLDLLLRQVELVGQQQAELEERAAAIERRDEKIRALEEELAQFRRPVKTPENSSVPPSRGQKANRAAGRHRKHGPKRGHSGVSRRRSEPEMVVECRPSACNRCGEPLPQVGGRRVGRSQVTEVPPVEPVVIEAWQFAVTCPHCGTQTVGAYPPGLEPRRTFGPRIEALLSYLHERHHVSYERLVELSRDVLGLQISQGGVENALRRLVERARPTYAAIRKTVRASSVINSDETSARVEGRTQWQWTFQTPEASYHLIAPSRAGEVIDTFLDGAEPAVWGSDLYAPQMLTAATAHQICHSHQARDLTFAAEVDTSNERLWALELRHVFGRAIRLHRERAQVTPTTFARRRTRIEKATDRLVFERYVAPKTEAARLQQRYRTHRDSLYVFLDRDDVDPTNNSSERDLRPSVIHRTVIGGFRSAWGAEASAIRTSILATARKQGRNLLDALCAIAGPSPLQNIAARL